MRTMKWIIQRLRLPLTPALVMVVTGLLCPAPAGAILGDPATLDQSQPVSQSPANVSSGAPKAQIFTPGLYGVLDRVSVYVNSWSSPPTGAVFTVSVQTVIGGLPSGKQIGSGTLALSAIPLWGSWVDVGIHGAPGHGALVHAGTQYALVLQMSANATADWWFAGQDPSGSSYSRGAMAVHDGSSWRIEGNLDFTFKTYVIPDVLDQSQTSVGPPEYSSEGGVHQTCCGWTWWLLGQTFTPAVSGYLDRVSIYMNYENHTDLYFTIQTVTGGHPSGNVIGQGFLPYTEGAWDPWHRRWFTVDINDALVVAGTQYALVVQGDPRDGSCCSGVPGKFTWWYDHDVYSGGQMMYQDESGWHLSGNPSSDATFQTYVIPPPPISFSPPPPPATITPCFSGICPAVSGSVTPIDSAARVTSNVQFQARPDGTVHGILSFNDSRTGNFVLQGCATNSAACQLTVTTFACTDQHAIRVAGTYTPKGGTATGYQLSLAGLKEGIGSFTLTVGSYTYTLTKSGIADVTCPPIATR